MLPDVTPNSLVETLSPPLTKGGATSTTSFRGRCYSTILKGCKLVALSIKLLVVIIFSIIAIPFIFGIGVVALTGGAVKLAYLNIKAKKQPVIPNKTREVKEKEHQAKFSAMQAVISTPSFVQEFAKLKQSRAENDPELMLIENFLSFFENAKDPNSYPQYNREFVYFLRDALKGDFYQNFIQIQEYSSEHVTLPLGIKMLQEFSLDIFLGVKAMPYYQELGETIVDEVRVASPTKAVNTAQDVAPFLEESIKVVKKTMPADSGFFGKSAYALTHGKQAVAALASVTGGKKIGRVLGKEGKVYDTHGKIANNPSVQGTTVWKGAQDNHVHVDNIFCASPTIGDDTINPELLCVLDAIAANNRLPIKQRNPKIPNTLVYTNFQNLASNHGEGVRSVTLMRLAEKYPTAFVGITLSKDSDFYLGKNNAWSELHTVEQFGARLELCMSLDMQKGLTHRVNNKTHHGFYFSPVARNLLENVLPTIILNATELFKTKETPTMTPAERKEMYVAYQEFVYSLVQDFIEMEFAKDPSITRLMTITACKEHADRAAMESLKKLYLRWFSQKQLDANGDQSISLLCAGMHARALETRERLVVEHRTKAVLAFMKYITPEEYQMVRCSLNPQVSVEFAPALS